MVCVRWRCRTRRAAQEGLTPRLCSPPAWHLWSRHLHWGSLFEGKPHKSRVEGAASSQLGMQLRCF